MPHITKQTPDHHRSCATKRMVTCQYSKLNAAVHDDYDARRHWIQERPKRCIDMITISVREADITDDEKKRRI